MDDSFVLLSAITPVAKNKSEKKPKITKFTLKRNLNQEILKQNYSLIDLTDETDVICISSESDDSDLENFNISNDSTFFDEMNKKSISNRSSCSGNSNISEDSGTDSNFKLILSNNSSENFTQLSQDNTENEQRHITCKVNDLLDELISSDEGSEIKKNTNCKIFKQASNEVREVKFLKEKTEENLVCGTKNNTKVSSNEELKNISTNESKEILVCEMENNRSEIDEETKNFTFDESDEILLRETESKRNELDEKSNNFSIDESHEILVSETESISNEINEELNILSIDESEEILVRESESIVIKKNEESRNVIIYESEEILVGGTESITMDVNEKSINLSIDESEEILSCETESIPTEMNEESKKVFIDESEEILVRETESFPTEMNEESKNVFIDESEEILDHGTENIASKVNEESKNLLTDESVEILISKTEIHSNQVFKESEDISIAESGEILVRKIQSVSKEIIKESKNVFIDESLEEIDDISVRENNRGLSKQSMHKIPELLSLETQYLPSHQQSIAIEESSQNSSLLTSDNTDSNVNSVNKLLLTSDESTIEHAINSVTSEMKGKLLITSDESDNEVIKPAVNISISETDNEMDEIDVKHSDNESDDALFITAKTFPSDTNTNEGKTIPKLKRYSEFGNVENKNNYQTPIDKATEQLLNELYGNLWKTNTKTTPKTESKVKLVSKSTVIKRFPQTERPQKRNKPRLDEISTTQIDFKKFSQKVRPDFESTRTPITKHKDSQFIVNDSDSEIEVNNTPSFHNFIANTKAKMQLFPSQKKDVSLLTKKILEICDPESDDETPLAKLRLSSASESTTKSFPSKNNDKSSISKKLQQTSDSDDKSNDETPLTKLRLSSNSQSTAKSFSSKNIDEVSLSKKLPQTCDSGDKSNDETTLPKLRFSSNSDYITKSNTNEKLCLESKINSLALEKLHVSDDSPLKNIQKSSEKSISKLQLSPESEQPILNSSISGSNYKTPANTRRLNAIKSSQKRKLFSQRKYEEDNSILHEYNLEFPELTRLTYNETIPESNKENQTYVDLVYDFTAKKIERSKKIREKELAKKKLLENESESLLPTTKTKKTKKLLTKLSEDSSNTDDEEYKPKTKIKGVKPRAKTCDRRKRTQKVNKHVVLLTNSETDIEEYCDDRRIKSCKKIIVSSTSSESSSSSSDSECENVRYRENSSDDDQSVVIQQSLNSRNTKLSFLASLSNFVSNAESDSDAQMYKLYFKDKKEELAIRLFTLFNKEVFNQQIPPETPIEWNARMRGTAGFCYNRRVVHSNGDIERSCRIVLSSKVIDQPSRLRDTLIHEMCHAASWHIDHISNGHGPSWQAWARRAISRFPELPPIRRCHDYDINTKYTYKCVNCGYSIGRHSKSLDVNRKRCGYCYGQFELLLNKKSKDGVIKTVATPKASKPLNGFALFVKENYKSVKQETNNLKHGDVMKLLGQKFSALKMADNNIEK